MVLTLVERQVIGHNLNPRMRQEAVHGERLGELNQGLPHLSAESAPVTMTVGDSTVDSELDDVDEEATNVSISPQAETTLFPSRVPEESQLQYNHMPNGRVENSRESVLQRLSEALLQRSLTKVRFYRDGELCLPNLFSCSVSNTCNRFPLFRLTSPNVV
jgi:hypothetical protein